MFKSLPVLVNQDHDTATAIGSKSYNTLMGELVSLETRNIEVQPKNNIEEDCVDFVAATTAALGVPSPSLSKARSFDDSPQSVSDRMPRKGDLEEEAELLRAMKLSEAVSQDSVSDPIVDHVNGNGLDMSISMDENMSNVQAITVDSGDNLGKNIGKEKSDFREAETSIPDDCTASSKDNNEHTSSESTLGEAANSSLKTDAISGFQKSVYMVPEEAIERNEVVENHSLDALVPNESVTIPFPEKHPVSLFESCADATGGDANVHSQSPLTTVDHEVANESQGLDATGISCLSTSHTNSDSSSVRLQTDASGALPSTIDGNEPIYEGEECVLDTRPRKFEDREPVYEGEAVLAEQADNSTLAALDQKSKDEITPEQGQCCYLLSKWIQSH